MAEQEESPATSLLPSSSSTIFLYDGKADDIPFNVTHVLVESSVIVIRAQTFMAHFNLTEVLNLPEGLLVEIQSRAFFACESLRYIHIPSTVRMIGSGAFAGCDRLQQIELPDGLQSIGAAAFSNCGSLSHLRIPPLITWIRTGAFANCFHLYSVELSAAGSLERIGTKAFRNCKQLRNIVLPLSVIQIGDSAFDGCTALYDEFFSSMTPGRLGYPRVWQDELLIQRLKTILDEYPLHKLCYYQSYYESFESLRQALQDMHLLEWEHDDDDDHSSPLVQRDILGMTPLHRLALSAKPNIEFCLLLLSLQQRQQRQVDMPALDIRDRWDRDALMYCSMNLSSDSTEMTRLLIQVKISPQLNSLRLEEWRTEVTTEMDNLLLSSTTSTSTITRQDRVRQMGTIYSKLEYLVRKEKLSLLEMAIWQAKIDSSFHCIDDDDDDVPLNIRREECRMMCGANIIIPHTLLFLGPKWW
eukprot:scaffold1776_cov106-Cylindrotheca_fusiformis.AAC.3